MTGDVARVVTEAVREIIRFTQASERLRGALVLARTLDAQIAEAIDLDPELAPELAVVRESLDSAGEAILRSAKFIVARQETVFERIGEEGP